MRTGLGGSTGRADDCTACASEGGSSEVTAGNSGQLLSLRLFRLSRVYKIPRSLGSKASRRPSPTMLKPNTTSMIAMPGANERMGSVVR